MEPDLALVHSFKNGDQSAFEALVNKYRDRVYRIVYSMLQNRHEADDVTQEVFLRVYFRIGSFGERSSFFTWLYSIAINECRHHLRKNRRVLLSLDAPLSEDGAAPRLGDLLRSNETSPDTRLINEEQAQLLHRMIDVLPAKYKAVYVLRNIDDLSYKEIAQVMGISIEKVKVWLFRARGKMDELMKPLYGTDTAGGGER